MKPLGHKTVSSTGWDRSCVIRLPNIWLRILTSKAFNPMLGLRRTHRSRGWAGTELLVGTYNIQLGLERPTGKAPVRCLGAVGRCWAPEPNSSVLLLVWCGVLCYFEVVAVFPSIKRVPWRCACTRALNGVPWGYLILRGSVLLLLCSSSLLLAAGTSRT